MKRHPFNVFSFGLGIVLILLSIGLVFPIFNLADVARSRWLVPVVLVLVGVAMLSPLVKLRKTDEEPADDIADEPAPVEPDDAAGTDPAPAEAMKDEHSSGEPDGKAEAASA